MNIGEISKPSVDRSRIKKKHNVKSTVPILPSKKVGDLVELSEESKHKYEQDSAYHHSPDSKTLEPAEETKANQGKSSIDVKV